MGRIAFVLKGYPRLSETFIAQEIRGLEARGIDITIISLRPPRDKERHPVHKEIRAEVHYLPEHLHRQPGRCATAFARQISNAGFYRALLAFVADFWRNPGPDLFRRLGQGVVMAAEMPRDIQHLHAHFLHTPATVTRYAALLRGLSWTASAHAKDIWTLADNEKRAKLRAMEWLVTCSANAHAHLQALAPDPTKISLLYHGIDLQRFNDHDVQRPLNDGSQASAPIALLSVGRAVKKKGLDVLIEALATLPADLHWRWTHIGEGDELAALKALARARGLNDKISWQGARAQAQVIEAYRKADLFALPCRITADGDRDGLPNVLMEAMSQGLACISTHISGVPELIDDGDTGRLVAPDDVAELAAALRDLMTQPHRRLMIGKRASAHLRQNFNCEDGFDLLAQRFAATLARRLGKTQRGPVAPMLPLVPMASAAPGEERAGEASEARKKEASS